MKKFGWIITGIVVVILIVFVYWRFYFVLAEGTQAGTLNIFQKKEKDTATIRAIENIYFPKNKFLK